MDTIRTRTHKRLIEELIAARKAAGVTQVDLARQIRRNQSWMTRLESGQRRVDVVEFLMLAQCLGFNPLKMLARLASQNPEVSPPDRTGPAPRGKAAGRSAGGRR